MRREGGSGRLRAFSGAACTCTRTSRRGSTSSRIRPTTEDEAAFVTPRRRRGRRSATPETLLELGSGGGNNASHLKARFDVHAHRHLARHARAEPHAQPRVRAPRGRHANAPARPQFDVVFIHDAISYLTTEDDLARRSRPPRVHVRPGGVVILTPDATTEIFKPTHRPRRTRRRRRSQPALPRVDARPEPTALDVRRRLPDRRSRSRRRASRRPRPAHARTVPARRRGRD